MERFHKTIHQTNSAKLRPDNILRTSPKIVLTSAYGPIYNAKGRINGGTSLWHTQDVNLTIIRKMDFYKSFSVFPDSNCISDNGLQK